MQILQLQQVNRLFSSRIFPFPYQHTGRNSFQCQYLTKGAIAGLSSSSIPPSSRCNPRPPVSYSVSISSHFCLPINTEALHFSTSSRKLSKLIRFCCWCCNQIETSVTSLRLIFENLWSVLSECLELKLLIWRRKITLILLKAGHLH